MTNYEDNQKGLAMLKFGIVTFQDGYNRGACDFYPLIRWKREFSEAGFKFTFFRSHKDKKLFSQDIVGIDHRYYRELTILKNRYPDKQFIIELIEKLKSKSIKVLLFDNGDGAGGRQWELIEEVDALVKKQLLKNKKDYTVNRDVFSYMPFTEEYELSRKTRENNLNSDKYFPCPADQLHKIKLGWNIGMKDYRWFPMKRYYPFGTSRLLNQIYKIPTFKKVRKERPIGSTFRGALKGGNVNYAYQRNKVIKLFSRESQSDLQTGDIVSKRKYMNELSRSKTCVSPFGWGEVCYRDFEAILSGSLLIKPDMSHLETYPDVYKKDETYVPLRWDIADLEETLNRVLDNYESYQPLVENSQQIYKEALTDSDQFISHFKTILE